MLTAQRKIKTTRFRTTPEFAQPDLKVDASNGVIKDVAIVTAGEAKGHGIFLDQSFVEDVVRMGNEFPQGVKCRFGHPTLSNEALGTYLGRFKNFRVKQDKAIGDLYLDDVAKQSPNGDLYSWITAMAAKNPDQFGTSIIFIPDESYQVIEGERKPVSDDDAPVYATIKELCAADLVDEPAANDEGLFSSTRFNADKFAVRLTEFLDNNPDVWKFIDRNPEKFTPFLAKYNAYKKSIDKKRKIMSTKKHVSFMTRLARAFMNDKDVSEFAQVDAVTDDGQNIRIDAANDAPAVGDPVYIVDPSTDEATVAPDGDYTVAGGDFDGFKYTVVNGAISAVFDPNTPDITVQQSV